MLCLEGHANHEAQVHLVEGFMRTGLTSWTRVYECKDGMQGEWNGSDEQA